ncbi:hypothetical protein ACHAQI_005745 [Fusarium lateritium]
MYTQVIPVSIEQAAITWAIPSSNKSIKAEIETSSLGVPFKNALNSFLSSIEVEILDLSPESLIPSEKRLGTAP